MQKPQKLSCVIPWLFFLLVLLTSSITIAVAPPHPELIKQYEENGEIEKLATRISKVPKIDFNQYRSRQYDFSTAVNAGTTDTLNVPVILVDFFDHQAEDGEIYANNLQVYNRFFDYDSTDPRYTLTEYYYDNSYGSLFIKGEVFGWYEMPEPYANYVMGYDIATDAINAADDDIDFSQFDANNDGICDGLIILHAGPGDEQIGNGQHIWSYMSTTYDFRDGVLIEPFCLVPEEYSGLGLITIGVVCHEFGHVLWLPDLYDYDLSSRGIGNWGLMGYGSWADDGRHPAYFTPWSKKELGFLDLIEVSANLEDVALPMSVYNPVAYRIWEDGTIGNEYFIVENRQDHGMDFWIPGRGVMIYHIDESQWGNDDEWHPLVGIEQADGLFEMENSNSYGDLEDGWSTYTQTNFDEFTIPNSRKHDGSPSKTAVWNISANDSIMYVNLDINYSRPYFTIMTYQFSDALYGDNDGSFEAGETITFTCQVQNLWASANNVTLGLSTDNGNYDFIVSEVNMGTIAAEGGVLDNSSTPIQFTMPDFIDPCIDSFEISIVSDNIYNDYTLPIELYRGTPKILVVDDDGGDSWQLHITNTLHGLRQPYVVYDKSISGVPSLSDLQPFELVIWTTGDDRPGIISSPDISVWQQYLDTGGNLLLTGQSLPSQINDIDPVFMADYLKATFDDTLFYPIINGEPGSPIGDNLTLRFDSWTNQLYTQTMNTVTGGSVEFRFPSGEIVGISHSNGYKALILGFGFEGISNLLSSGGYATQAECMMRLFSYFSIYSASEALNPSVSSVTLLNVPDSSHVTDHTPEFSWSVTDTTGSSIQQYHWRLGTGQTCSDINNLWDSGVLDGSDTSATYTGSGLNDGETYYFSVQVNNGLEWSSWQTSQFHMNGLTSTFNVVTPVEQQLIATLRPTLHVECTDPENDPMELYFEVYNDSTLTSLITSSVAITGSGAYSWVVDVELLENTRYFWRVYAFDGLEYSGYSQVSSFYINTANEPPGSCTLIAPLQSASEIPLTPELTWSKAVDPDPLDFVFYSIYISDSPDFSTYDRYYNIQDTSYQFVSPLEQSKTYYWYVSARDYMHATTLSADTFTFTTLYISCCVGTTGNVNGDIFETVDISDLLFFVDYQFIPESTEPPCLEEADVDGSGEVDVSDLLYLVDYMFVPGSPNPVICP